MSGTASDAWFWNDWQAEPTLRLCSFAAQGVWARLLCIAAEAKPKGFVLLGGKKPSVEDLVKIVGGTVSEVEPLVQELCTRGVCSVNRAGVIYCRRMVRDAKKREASAKGGRIGGRVTHGKGVGIFGTQDATLDGTQHPIPFPSHSHKKVSNGKETFSQNGSGNNGRGRGDGFTIENPEERMRRFEKKIAEEIGQGGWQIVMAAQTPTAPEYARCLKVCKEAARRLGKGWPRLWPSRNEESAHG